MVSVTSVVHAPMLRRGGTAGLILGVPRGEPHPTRSSDRQSNTPDSAPSWSGRCVPLGRGYSALIMRGLPPGLAESAVFSDAAVADQVSPDGLFADADLPCVNDCDLDLATTELVADLRSRDSAS